MSARENEAAAADARADELLTKAHEILEEASKPLRASGNLHSRARLARCAEAQPLLDEIHDLRTRARCLRTPAQSAPKTVGLIISTPIPPTKVEPVPSAATATRDQRLDALAKAFPDVPAGMLAHAKASGQSPDEFAADAVALTDRLTTARAREAHLTGLANDITAFVPGAKPIAPQTIRADDPATSEDELVASIVAFLPPESRSRG